MRDAAAQKVRTERHWRLGPKQFTVALPQIRDWRRRQPLQFRFNRWIGCRPQLLWRRSHDAAPGFAE
jgi:hypothetical protein